MVREAEGILNFATCKRSELNRSEVNRLAGSDHILSRSISARSARR